MSNRWLIGVNEKNYYREHGDETKELEKNLEALPVLWE